MRLKIALLATLLTPVVWAGDPDSGAELYKHTEFAFTINGELRDDVTCSDCHEPASYKRPERQAMTYGNIRYWVGACNLTMDAGWFPDEVEDVVAYLNREYYQYEYSPELN